LVPALERTEAEEDARRVRKIGLWKVEEQVAAEAGLAVAVFEAACALEESRIPLEPALVAGIEFYVDI
jgi:hypothetical protein